MAAENDNSVERPQAEPLGVYVGRRLVRAFQREAEMRNIDNLLQTRKTELDEILGRLDPVKLEGLALRERTVPIGISDAIATAAARRYMAEQLKIGAEKTATDDQSSDLQIKNLIDQNVEVSLIEGVQVGDDDSLYAPMTLKFPDDDRAIYKPSHISGVVVPRSGLFPGTLGVFASKADGQDCFGTYIIVPSNSQGQTLVEINFPGSLG